MNLDDFLAHFGWKWLRENEEENGEKCGKTQNY